MAMVPVELTADELDILVNSNNVGYARKFQLEKELLQVMRDNEAAQSVKLRDDIMNHLSDDLSHHAYTAWCDIVRPIFEVVANNHTLKESFLEHLEHVQKRVDLEKSVHDKTQFG